MCCALRPKTLRYTNGCLTVVALMILIPVMIVSIISTNSYLSGLHFFEATRNWYREPILDVTVIDPTSGVCSNDSQSIFDFAFEGLKLGCDCTATGGKVTTGKCNTTTQAACQNIAETPAAVYSKWMDPTTSTPLNLCFKRLIDYKYYKKYLKESKCRDPANEKMCGGSNPLYAFCVPKTAKCPVQSISVSQINASDEQIGTTGLWIQRDQPDQIPLSEAQAGATKGICTSYQYKYTADRSKEYSLLSSVDKYSTCEIDPKYTFVQSITSSQFYTANGLTGTNQPAGLVASQSTSLFQRKYVPWKLECRQGDEFEQMVDVSLDFASDAQSRSSYWKIVAANIGLLAFYGLFLMMGCFTTQPERKWCSFKNCCKIDCCLCCCCKEGCTFNGCCTLRMPFCIRQWWIKKSYEPLCSDYCFLVDPLHLLLIVVKFVLDIVLLALAFKNMAKAKSYSGNLSDLAAKQCSDKLVNDSLQETSDNISGTAGKCDVIIIVLMVLYFIGSVIAVGTYISNQVTRRRALIKRKLDAQNTRSLAEKDQTFPTIHTEDNDVENFVAKHDGTNIQMQQNPQQNNSQLPLYNPHDQSQNHAHGAPMVQPYNQVYMPMQQPQQVGYAPQGGFANQQGMPFQQQPYHY